MIRVFSNYRTIEKPWGGANNFLKALQAHWLSSGEVRFVDDIEDDYDILFLNAIGTGPGRPDPRKLWITPHEIASIKASGRSSLWRRLTRGRNGTRKVVLRSINLEKSAFRRLWLTRRDRHVIAAMNLADHVILQSGYMEPIFRSAGYEGEARTIVHNGADALFHAEGRVNWDGHGPLRLLSCTFSERKSKRFDFIAEVSRLPDVECVHVGRWPADVPPGRVQVLGVRTREEVAGLMREYHAFLHPAVRDPCPNVVMEALSSGLPVLYARDSGTCEMAEKYGEAVENGPKAAIDRLRQNYSQHIRAIETDRENFGCKRAARQYLDIFHSVLGLSHGEIRSAGSLLRTPQSLA